MLTDLMTIPDAEISALRAVRSPNEFDELLEQSLPGPMRRGAVKTKTIAGYESSGYHSTDTKTLRASILRLINGRVYGVPVTYGVHTEAYTERLWGAFSVLPGNWDARRVAIDDPKTGGAREIVITFDRDHWAVVEPSVRAFQMTTQRIYTSAGKPREFTAALEAMLANVEKGRSGGALTVQGGHWDLSNTANRRASWLLGRTSVQQRWMMLDELLDSQVAHLCDINKDYRAAAGRADIESVVKNVPGYRCAWDLTNPLPKDGTHGKRIIDVGLTNMANARMELLADDASSDHRPVGMLSTFDCTRGLVPRRVLAA